jgi:nucleotide-binding universal stress UspA family protein
VHLPLRKLGVAVDFPPVADNALEHALEWADWVGIGAEPDSHGTPDLRVVHVVTSAQHDGSQAQQGLQELTQRVMDGRPSNSRIRVTSELLVDPDPAAAITRWADRSGVDLLVAGTGATKVDQTNVLGSFASAIARRAPCPVLLIPAVGAQIA